MNTEPRLASQHTLAVLLVRATSDTDAGVPRSTSMMITWVAVASLACLIILAGAQGQAPLLRLDQPKPKCDGQARSTYLLGPDDQLEISEPELAELAPANKPIRIDGDGDIQVPLAGRVHVSGLTVQQAEEKLDQVLRAYVLRPQVAVNVAEVHSQPVSILGQVNKPGVYQVQGHKTLLEMLALAGGLQADAGYSIRITRELDWGCIPLPKAQLDASGQFSVAEVDLKKILEDPEENIQIYPHDVVSVPKAEMVYVIGEVKRAGGFVLGEHQSISVLQALALAEGLSPLPMHGTPRSCGSSPMPLSAKRWPWILRMFSGERNRMSHFGATTFCSSRPARAERPLCAPLKRQFKQEHLPSGGYPEAGPESCENKGGPEAIGLRNEALERPSAWSSRDP